MRALGSTSKTCSLDLTGPSASSPDVAFSPGMAILPACEPPRSSQNDLFSDVSHSPPKILHGCPRILGVKHTLCTLWPLDKAFNLDLLPTRPSSLLHRPSFYPWRVTHLFLSLGPCNCCSLLECMAQLTVIQGSSQNSPPQRSPPRLL